MHEPERAVLVFHRELALGADRHIVDFAGRKIGHVGLVAAAKPVAFLRFLLAEFELERVLGAVVEMEVEFDPVGAGHALAELFGLDADFVIIDGQAGAENDVIDPVQRGAAEAVLFGGRGERRGRRVGRDAEDEIVIRIDVLLEAELATIGGVGLVGQVEIAAAGHFVGVDLAAFEAELVEDAVFQTLVEDIVRFFLHGEAGVLQEFEVLDIARVFEVDEDADALAGLGFESLLEQTAQTEGREGSVAHGLMQVEF